MCCNWSNICLPCLAATHRVIQQYITLEIMAARNSLNNAEAHNTPEWLLYLIFAAFWQYYILVLVAAFGCKSMNICLGCAEPEPVSAHP